MTFYPNLISNRNKNVIVVIVSKRAEMQLLLDISLEIERLCAFNLDLSISPLF